MPARQVMGAGSGTALYVGADGWTMPGHANFASLPGFDVIGAGLATLVAWCVVTLRKD